MVWVERSIEEVVNELLAAERKDEPEMSPEELEELDERLLGSDDPLEASPEARRAARRRVARLRQRFRAGDNSALLLAIKCCGATGIPLPEWVAMVFSCRLNSIFDGETDSLDVAFGRMLPPGTHLRSYRGRRQLWPLVYRAIQDILKKDPSIPLDQDLYEQVGDQFGIGKTLCGELYRHGRAALEACEREEAQDWATDE
jgi:hypothetical protein